MPIRLIIAGLAMTLLAGCASLPNPLAGQAAAPTVAATAPAGASDAPAHNDPRVAMLVGAGTPALVGPAIGAYMDQEEDELRTQLQSTGASVTRAGNVVVVMLPADVAFDANKSVVRPQFSDTLVSVGVVLKHFPKSIVNVYGFTDPQSAGSDLTQRRAVAVATALSNQGVDQRRFYIEGRGAADPIASNATDAGRAQNRRVEIQISPLA